MLTAAFHSGERTRPRVRSPNMIDARHIVKNYGRKLVLRGISLQAQPKQITLMVGPNGAGKSTTIKVLAGLIRPAAALKSTASTSSMKQSGHNVRLRICRNDRAFIRS